jgi:hypothetical protein
MVVVAHEAVEIVGCPKTASAPQQRVNARTCVRLPTFYDRSKRMLTHGPDDCVHVVRHYAPSAEHVTLSVESMQRHRHNVGDRPVAQKRFAKSTIKRCVQSRALNIPAEQGRALHDVRGETVGESKHDMLKQMLTVTMRKITAMMPTAPHAGTIQERLPKSKYESPDRASSDALFLVGDLKSVSEDARSEETRSRLLAPTNRRLHFQEFLKRERSAFAA